MARCTNLHKKGTPVARPNTRCPFQPFDPADTPAFQSHLNHDAWETLLAAYPEPDLPYFILGVIRHGALLGYTGPLRQSGRGPVRNHNMPTDALKAVRKQVSSAVAAGFTRVLSTTTGATFSPIGAVPKKDSDSYRLINDLSSSGGAPELGSVNDGIAFPPGTMTYETIDSFFTEVASTPDTDDLVIWKVDLKDAFRHVPVATRDTLLLTFSMDGVHYADCALNFGGASSPFLFNLFAEGLHWILNYFGLPVHHYLDDFFGMCPRSDAPAILRFVTATCSFLGLSVSQSKTTYGSCISVLGFTVHLPSKVAWLPPRKIARLQGSIKSALGSRRLSLTQAETLAGLLSDAVRVCRVGRAFSRAIFDWISEHRGPKRASRTLPRDLLGDLRWWNKILRDWSGASLLHVPTGTCHIWSDATGAGRLGAHLGPASNPVDSFATDAPAEYLSAGILTLEALAVLEALAHWGPQHVNHVVLLTVDNMALAFALVSGRVAHRPTQQVLRAIFSIVFRYNLSISVSWVPSHENVLADAISRQPGPTSHPKGTVSDLLTAELRQPIGTAWLVAPS